jgi:hypothetical protein
MRQRGLGQSEPSHVCLAQSVVLSRRRHLRYGGILVAWHVTSTFLRSFARRALPRVFAPTNALTPGRPALRVLIRDNEHRPCLRPGLPASRRRIFRPFRLQPPLVAPWPWSGFVPRAYRQHDPRSFASLPRDQRVSWASPFPSGLATTTGRIEFVILRTGRSPPVASHPLSRGRSYLRLQSTDLTLTGTFTPLIQRAHRRTRVRALHARWKRRATGWPNRFVGGIAPDACVQSTHPTGYSRSPA